MTIKECEGRINPIKQLFRDYFHNDFDVDVFLIGKAAIQTKRTAIFSLCGEQPFPFSPTTLGETAHGKHGTAIILYPFNIKYPREFDHTLCHELGHAFFTQSNSSLVEKLRHTTLHDEGGLAVFGLSVWSEFIAECIANLVLNEEPDQILFPKQEQLIHLLYEALPGLDKSKTARANKSMQIYLDGYMLNQYALAHYCAMYLTDPTTVFMFDVKPNACRGLEECSEKEWRLIDDILDCLCKKLDEDDFWVVNENWLSDLGDLTDKLWNCRMIP